MADVKSAQNPGFIERKRLPLGGLFSCVFRPIAQWREDEIRLG
jgi:hypothetical protein